MTRTTTRSIFRFVAGLALAAVIAVELPGPGPERGPQRTRYLRSTKQVAPGVTFMRIVDRRGPNRISALRVDLTRTTIDVALAKDALPGLETTSSMARRRGAVAAINGDYFFTHGHAWMGRPVNTYAEDGELMASPTIWGRNVAVAQDESETFMGHFPLDVSVLEYDTGQTHRVRLWNAGPPRRDELAGFTPAGGSAMRTPRDQCAVRLYPASETQWHAESTSVVQDMEVDVATCRSDRLARRRGTVISGPFASRSGLLLTQSLVEGEVVRLSWSLGVAGVLDTLGGNPMLMENGRLAAGTCEGSSFCLRHPRTGVGVTRDGRLLLVVVDGRWRKRSVGMTPAQFARLFRYLGAYDAINLDGGGSSTMVVRGSVVNRPSDGRQRRVGNALLVLASPDVKEPPMATAPPSTPTPYLTPTTTPTPSPSSSDLLPDLPPYEVFDARTSACLAATDPASLGGYLDHLAARRARAFVQPLDRTLLAFRRASGMRACL